MKPYFIVFALSLISLNAQAAVNRWVDADGNVHYSDTPPAEVKTKPVRNISSKGQAEAPATYSPKSYVEREAELRKSRQEKEEATQKKTQQDAAAENRKANCASARENVRALEESSRIVTYDANGERVYLDDAAREQRLSDARKAVNDNCN